jgi:hypothetical protein
MIEWLMYVPIGDVEAYSLRGWEPVGDAPLHVPHGLYSVLMVWLGAGEPVEPAGGDRR